jgi:hypothetical protein
MDKSFPAQDKFAVFIDRDEYALEAENVFYDLKDNPYFPYHSRLATCTRGNMEEFVCLQPADLIAYEVFKRLHKTRRESDSHIREVLSLMYKHNTVDAQFFSAASLSKLKAGIESAVCGPNQLTIIPSE